VGMDAITPAEAPGLLQALEMVKEVELIELRRTSTDSKLQQLSVLMAFARLFGADPEREHGVQLVRDRGLLRQALGG